MFKSKKSIVKTSQVARTQKKPTAVSKMNNFSLAAATTKAKVHRQLQMDGK